MDKLVNNFNNKLLKHNLSTMVVFVTFTTLILISIVFIRCYITDIITRSNYTHSVMPEFSQTINRLTINLFLFILAMLPITCYLTKIIQKAINNKLEKKVQERTIELSRTLQGKSNFLANMSHEIRTPNHAVLNCSKYVETDLKKIIEGLEEYRKATSNPEAIDKLLTTAKSALKSATRIRDASNRQGVLLNNILDLSKLGEGKMEMNIASHNLKKVIIDVIKESEGLYKGGLKNLDVILEEPGIDTNAEFDSLRMTQVISNLLSNSIKYSAQGVITLRIKDSTIQTDNITIPALQCSISDEGIGIPANELEKIFEKFTESSVTKKQSCGTGIGLAICQEIILSHSGKIWAENNKDKGSTFVFVIPVKNLDKK